MRNELIPPLLGYYTMAGGGVVPPIIYDTFTDTNDTAIASHTPDVAPIGSAWANLRSTASIYNNRLEFAKDGSAIINSGISDYTITADITAYVAADVYARTPKIIFRHNLANGTNWSLVVKSYKCVYIAKDSIPVATADITELNVVDTQVLRLKVVCLGTSIKGYVNDGYEVSTTSSDYQTDTYVGAGCFRNSTHTYYIDEFKVVV